MWIERWISLNQGVSFFFVLSGFILQHNYRKSLSTLGPARFIGLRIARIWPTHIAVLVLICAYQWPLIFNHFISHYSDHQIASVLLLVQDWRFDFYSAFALNAPSWSISAELFFYSLFPLLSPAAIRRPILTSGIVAVCSLAWLLAMTIYKEIDPAANLEAAITIHPILRLFEFSLGISGYEIMTRWRQNRRMGKFSATVVELAAVMIHTNDYIHCREFTYFFCLILHLPLFQRNSRTVFRHSRSSF